MGGRVSKNGTPTKGRHGNGRVVKEEMVGENGNGGVVKDEDVEVLNGGWAAMEADGGMGWDFQGGVEA